MTSLFLMSSCALDAVCVCVCGGCGGEGEGSLQLYS